MTARQALRGLACLAADVLSTAVAVVWPVDENGRARAAEHRRALVDAEAAIERGGCDFTAVRPMIFGRENSLRPLVRVRSIVCRFQESRGATYPRVHRRAAAETVA